MEEELCQQAQQKWFQPCLKPFKQLPVLNAIQGKTTEKDK